MSLNLDKSTWARVAFGDVVRNANVTVRDPETVGIDRVIAMEHMDPGELKVQRWGSIEDGTTFTRRVTPGQTLFGKRRAYQRKVAFAEFDAICSGDILTFEADENHMLPRFLPFLVQSNEFFDHALGTSAGSLSPRTNWRDLSKYEFDLPPLDEQKRIADLLWAVEHHQNALGQLNDAMIVAAGKLLTNQLSSGTDNISKFADILVGFAFPSRSFALTTSSQSRPLLRGINIGIGATRWEQSSTVHWAEVLDERTSNYVLNTGDIVIPMDRPFTAAGQLRWAEVDKSDAGALLVQRVARIRPREARFSGLLRGIVRSSPFQQSLNGALTGSFAPHLAHGDFVRYQFNARSPEKATNSVEIAELAENASVREARHLRSIRESLLSDIFGGS